MNDRKPASNAQSTSERRICVGAFAGAHGVQGAAKIKTFTAVEKDVAAYGVVESEDGARRFTLKVSRVMKPGLVLVSAPEIAHREDAIGLAGTKLFVPRDRLPAIEATDEYYMEDLIGLTASTETGAPAGQVKAVHNFGAGDIIELSGISGRKGSVMVPFTMAATPTLDLANGQITVASAYLADALDHGVAARATESRAAESDGATPDASEPDENEDQ